MDGDPHGYGTYSWGPTTKWAGDVYVGNWSMGERTGYGVYSSPRPTGYKYDIELDGRYVVRGVFRKSELKELCTSESSCVAITTRPESKKKSPPKSQWEFGSETDKFTDRITQIIATKSSNRLNRILMIACSGGEMALVYQHSFSPLISDNDRAELIVRIDDNEVHRFRFSDLSFDGTMTGTSINEEAKLIAEMKAGLEIAVQSSTRDLEISYEGSVEDVFSLIGFTAASRKLDCIQ